MEEVVGEPHPADVDEEAQLLVLVEPLDVAVPELDRVLLDGGGGRLLLGRERRGRGVGGAGGGGGAGEVRDGMGRAEAEVGGAHEELPPEAEAARGAGGGRRGRAGD